MRSLKRVLDEMSELSIKLMDTRDYTVFWNSDNEEYLERIIAESRECYMCKVKGCEQRKKTLRRGPKGLKPGKTRLQRPDHSHRMDARNKKACRSGGLGLI